VRITPATVATRTAAALAALGVFAALAACSSALLGAAAPVDTFYYPIGIAVSSKDPTGNQQFAYVVSSNFDQEYSTGWISVVDLQQAWTSTNGQLPPTMARLLVRSLGGPLSGPLTLETDPTTNHDVLLVGHRGSSTVTLVEATTSAVASSISCGDSTNKTNLDSQEKLTDCDRAHLVKNDALSIVGSPSLAGTTGTVPGPVVNDLIDPYSTALFDFTPQGGTNQHVAIVGHLSSPWLLAYNITGSNGLHSMSLVQATDIGGGTTEGLGQVGIIPNPLNNQASGQVVYATSRVYGMVPQYSTIYSMLLSPLWAGTGGLNATINLNGQIGGDNVGAMAVSKDGKRAYFGNQNPGVLAVLDTDQGDQGTDMPRYAVLSEFPLPRKPVDVLYVDRPPAGGGPLVAVASFDDDSVYLFRPVGTTGDQVALLARVTGVGLGPVALAHATLVTPLGIKELILATTFFDHGLSMINVTYADTQDDPALVVKYSKLDLHNGNKHAPRTP